VSVKLQFTELGLCPGAESFLTTSASVCVAHSAMSVTDCTLHVLPDHLQDLDLPMILSRECLIDRSADLQPLLSFNITESFYHPMKDRRLSFIYCNNPNELCARKHVAVCRLSRSNIKVRYAQLSRSDMVQSHCKCSDDKSISVYVCMCDVEM